MPPLICIAACLLEYTERKKSVRGYAHTELEGQPLEVLLPGRFRSVHSDHLARYFSAPTTRPLGSGLPLFGMRKDGTEFPVDISLTPIVLDETHLPGGMRWFEYVARPVLGQDGTIESVVLSSADITERRDAADTLRRLATIVESSAEAILSMTPEGIVTSWNSSAEKLLGYRAEEIIGQSIALTVPPHHHQEFRDVRARINRGKTVKDYETIRIRKDGTPVEVSITVNPVLDHKGGIVGASAIAHDITEHKRLIRELMDVNAALIEAKKVRDQFFGTMSHELRTPLASIIGFSEMLLKGDPEAELNLEQCEDVECILRNGYHLLDLVNDVLDLEKIEAQRMEIAFTSVDVKHLLTTVVKEIQSIADAHHIVLSVEVEEGIGSIETDRLRLQQVFLNLVSNALKFTKQGAITVSASFVAHSGEQATSIAIAVKDNGIGIPLDKQGQAFRRKGGGRQYTWRGQYLYCDVAYQSCTASGRRGFTTVASSRQEGNLHSST